MKKDRNIQKHTDSVVMRGLRFMLYLFRCLLKPKTIVVDGTRIAIDYKNWSPFMTRRILSGNYELQERKALEQILRPSDRILEIGGGIGLTALTARKFTQDKNITLYEANPALIENIRHNFCLNDAKISLMNAAIVSDDWEEKKATFFIPKNFWSGGLNNNTTDSEKIVVDAIKLRDAIKTHNANVLIMDVEGAECEILREADLTEIDLLCLELHPHYTGRAEAEALILRLQSQGFVPVFPNAEKCVVTLKRVARFDVEPDARLSA
ncbi:FkbM family methyltransferase [Hyphococcus flavus]|uniref:FkbM family methyltransferase n=1 Tax=Hyphococcus flavus TaxID=1866326 RepID=A0AAE9ZFY9_9PROT|nr:FkbM family methyltransferase [Hyphococcus flavus]WDI33125.1 FkbM family methyltransferase [Hyphococcus flavus]